MYRDLFRATTGAAEARRFMVVFPPIMAKQYDENSIKTLSSLEHIRLRSGMYVGRLGDGSNFEDGIYVLLKEVVDNSIDEFIMGTASALRLRVVMTERSRSGTMAAASLWASLPQQ